MSLPSKESSDKFTPDGTALPFPGITVVHHLSDSNLRNALNDSEFSNYMDSLSHRYVRLPEDSYHSTLLDVKVYHPSRDKAFTTFTSAEQRRAADLEEYSKSFVAIQSDLSRLLPIRMTFDPSDYLLPKSGHPLGVQLVPYEHEDRTKIDSLREKLGSAFNMHADPGYRFHITLYYPITPISNEDFASFMEHWLEFLKRISDTVLVFEIDSIELCTFEDMRKFDVKKAVYEVSRTE